MTDDDAAGTSIGLFQGSDLSFEASCIDGLALLAISDDVSIRFDRSVLGDVRGLVRGTLPLVYMPERQTLRITRSIVTARAGRLVAARGRGSVVVEDSIVRGLRPSATPSEAAITIANGSSAALTRVAFVDNTSVALTVADADSSATLTDVDAQAASPAEGPALFCARGARRRSALTPATRAVYRGSRRPSSVCATARSCR